MSRTYPISPAQESELTNRFTYHAPKDNQIPRYGDLREQGRFLAIDIISRTPPGREQALALTALEEAIFWANAAIARGES